MSELEYAREMRSEYKSWSERVDISEFDNEELILMFAAYYSDLKLSELKERLFEIIMEPWKLIDAEGLSECQAMRCSGLKQKITPPSRTVVQWLRITVSPAMAARHSTRAATVRTCHGFCFSVRAKPRLHLTSRHRSRAIFFISLGRVHGAQPLFFYAPSVGAPLPQTPPTGRTSRAGCKPRHYVLGL